MSNLPEKLPESRIIEFLESGDECVVDLMTLIDIGVYKRKDHAVRALRKAFEEDTDFSSLKGKATTEGVSADSYLLTSGCFKEMCLMAESEMGRMVRRYYLEVERKWKQNKNTIPAPQSQAEMFLMVAQQMVEQERRTKELEAKVLRIEAAREDAIASLDETAQPEVEAEELTTRAKLNRLVRDYSAANALHFHEVWRRVYREFKDRYHTDLSQRAKNIQANGGKKFGALDVCEQLGKIEELYAVAFDLLKA